ncbi:CHASE2 and HATPase_c domain-containing protein [Granulosicoccaceae sp. 1_MG-2023]|nr:CHASE2 and HATPase_c domain-containing protein [Granulosicoccaceae sp. 1_MG-2023]
MRLASFNLRRINLLSILGIYLFLMLIALGLEWGGLTGKPDILLHDTWVRLASHEPPDDVVIVAIDSQSLQQYGRWPWSRDLQAQLVSRLQDAGATTLAMDVLYTEADNESRDNDLLLAQVMSGTPNLLLPILTGEFNAGRINPETLPIPDLTMVADDLGHVYMRLDPDGLVRRIDLKSGFRSAHWSSFGLALNELLGTAPEQLPGDRLSSGAMQYGWVSDYRTLLPFYGPGGSFTTISAARFLNGEAAEDELAGKVVFVGVTAVGLGDIHPTPVSTTELPMPGVEIHATVFSALRDGLMVGSAPALLSYAVPAVLMAVLLLLYMRLPPSGGLAAAVGFTLIPVLVSFIAYRYFQLWYAPLSASLPLLTSFALWSWHRLEFVGSFIQNEVSEMDEELRESTYEEPRSLVDFLNASLEHLPVAGWVFRSRGTLFSEGDVAALPPHPGSATGWQQRGSFYWRDYAGPDAFSIGLHILEPALAPQLTVLVDSLDRVQERKLARSRSDLAERLQIRAQQFNTRFNKLRRMSGLAESIFHDSPAGLVVWNAAGEFLRMNDRAYQMFPELLNSEVQLRHFLISVAGERESREIPEVLAGLLYENRPWQVDYDTAGSEKVISFSATGDQLAERLVMASIVDVSVMREAQRTRAEMMEYLSHDLRSPLISSTYLLSMQKEKLEGEDVRNLERVEAYITRSLDMIDDLLTMSRADNIDQNELEPVLFDNVVSNCLDQLMPQAAARGIRIRIHEDEEAESWVLGHAVLLERALSNVVGNALKYSGDQSSVEITILQQDGTLVCRVQDQGVGMDPARLERVFERFSRNASVERSHKGTGLGLALVGRVISQHGGRVYAFSEGEGKGTCITIELPLLEDGF